MRVPAYDLVLSLFLLLCVNASCVKGRVYVVGDDEGRGEELFIPDTGPRPAARLSVVRPAIQLPGFRPLAEAPQRIAVPERISSIAMGVKRKRRMTNSAKKANKEKKSLVVKQKKPASDGGPVGFAPAEASLDTSDLSENRSVQRPEMSTAESAKKISPLDAASPPGCEIIFALESADMMNSLRVGSPGAPPEHDDVLKALMEVESVSGEEPAMVAFVQANRDLLDYRFLYRLTSQYLRANYTGDYETAAALNAVRKRAVKACQRFDTPLFKQVGPAEERLSAVLKQVMDGKMLSGAEVAAAAASGRGPQATFAFWMVLVSAISAWEAKLEKSTEMAAKQIEKLSQLRDALEADTELMATSGVTPLQSLFRLPNLANPTGTVTAADSTRARATMERLVPDEGEQLLLARRIGALYCQAQRHALSAYNPFTQRAAALYDVLLRGETRLYLDPVDTKMPKREGPSDSLFVQFADKYRDYLKENDIEIPLFW